MPELRRGDADDREQVQEMWGAAMKPLVTVQEVKEAAERFIAVNKSNLPIHISVEVMDQIVPGRAMLLLMERPPQSLSGTVAYEMGVAFLRLSKSLDRIFRTDGRL